VYVELRKVEKASEWRPTVGVEQLGDVLEIEVRRKV